MTLPGVPSHIVQRGNDRHACFFEEDNYLFYLHCLEEASKRYRVAVHANVLMTNHVHLFKEAPLKRPSDILCSNEGSQFTGWRVNTP